MLWYKAWLDTRWRFLIGLAILMCSAMFVVNSYPMIEKLRVPARLVVDGELGRRVQEALALTSTYSGYIWLNWFRQDLSRTWIIFATLLGSGGLLAQGARGGAIYTLSLPVSRTRLLATRAATGLAELFVLALVPSLLIPLLSPLVGKSYSVVDALVHATCLAIAGSIFFSATFLLSTVFDDVWRPAAIVLLLAFVVSLWEWFSVHVMSAEAYFRGGGFPGTELLACVALSAAMLYLAVWKIEKEDF